MSHTRTLRVVSIELDEARLTRLVELLQKFAPEVLGSQVHIIASASRCYNIEVAGSNLRLYINRQGRLVIDVTGALRWEIKDLVEELAVAADYIVSAEQQGLVVEEVSVSREAVEEVNVLA